MTEKPKATIENVAFLMEDITFDQIQALLEIAKRHGIHFWRDAAQFYAWADDEEHVCFFSTDSGIDGRQGVEPDQILVSYETFLQLFKEYYEEEIKEADEAPQRNPKPRYRKRNRQKRNAAKTIARVIYKDQKTYTFKNLLSIQIIDGKVYIQHEKDVAEGIKESVETEIDVELVMAVVIHEVGNRATFFQNITGTWDFHNDDGTVIVSAQQLGRVFKKQA